MKHALLLDWPCHGLEPGSMNSSPARRDRIFNPCSISLMWRPLTEPDVEAFGPQGSQDLG
jgi:hypothetical protein